MIGVDWYLTNKVEEGRRNNALFIAAINALDHEIESIRDKAITVDGLPEREVDNTIRSAQRYASNRVDINDVYSCLFYEDEPLYVVLRDASGKIENIKITGGDLGEIYEQYYSYNGDVFYTINPCETRGNSGIQRFKHVLIECDDEPIRKQLALLEWLKPCAVCAYYSGNTSIHIICNTGDIGVDDYKRVVDQLYDHVSKRYKIDKVCKNPSRLSRLPGVLRNGVSVSPIYLNKNPITVSEFLLIDALPESLKTIGPPKRVSLINKTTPPVLIDGVVRCGGKVFVAGPAKVGKSMAMLSLASAMAKGGEWFGLNVARAKVLYVNIEVDEFTLLTRANSLTEAGINCTNLDVWTIRGAYTSGDDVIRGITTVSLARGYNAVIIDPIYLILDGDESDARAVSSFLRRIDEMIKKTGVTAILVHHFPKGQPTQRAFIDRMSGSSYFARWADAIISMAPTDGREGAFELGIMSRVLPSPTKSTWMLTYPTFKRIEYKTPYDIQIAGIK